MDSGPTTLLQGTLDLLILKSLIAGEMHGLGISRRVQQITGGTFAVKPGSLFPALHRMEEEGWISSFWGDSENNRRAKYYRLTHACGLLPRTPRHDQNPDYLGFVVCAIACSQQLSSRKNSWDHEGRMLTRIALGVVCFFGLTFAALLLFYAGSPWIEQRAIPFFGSRFYDSVLFGIAGLFFVYVNIRLIQGKAWAWWTALTANVLTLALAVLIFISAAILKVPRSASKFIEASPTRPAANYSTQCSAGPIFEGM